VQRARRFWLTIHTWLGLSLGLLWLVIALTGSLLVFYLEIDQWLNPQIRVDSSLKAQPHQAVFDTLYESFPEREGAWRVEQPLKPDRSLTARYYTPEETAHLQFAPLIVTLDPATLAITSERFWGEFVMTWLYNLHYALLLDKTGKILVGIFGLISLISLISGLYLWWPGWQRLRQRLAWKNRHGLQRKIYDWHVLSGSYGFVVLLLLSLTGAALALPDQTRSLLSQTSDLFSGPDRSQSPAHPNHQHPVSADAAVKLAMQRFPGAELRWVESPGQNNNSWRIILYQAGEPSRRFPRTTVWVDTESGGILAKRDGLQESGGDVLLNWLHPLHNGEVFGLTGRILVFISGLLPLLLFITGYLRWRHKRQAKMRKVLRSQY
jgi:uncharacterized iron-regulated membrane protein